MTLHQNLKGKNTSSSSSSFFFRFEEINTPPFVYKNIFLNPLLIILVMKYSKFYKNFFISLIIVSKKNN